MPDVVVIGGGLAGTAASAALRARGVDVQHIEGGHRPPRVPLLWDAKRTAMSKLAELVGVSVEKVAANARYLLRDGRLHSLELSPRALLSSKALSLRDRVSLAAEPVRVRMRPRQFGEDVSVGDFFRRHLGRQLTERVVLGMVNAMWAGDADALSMSACFPELLALERENGSILIGALKQALMSNGTLSATISTRGLAACLVEDIKGRNGSGVRINVVDNGGKKAIDAYCVVVATDAAEAARLTGVEDLSTLANVPVTLVHWRGDLMRDLVGWFAGPRENSFSIGGHAVGNGTYVSIVRGAPDEAAIARGLADEVRHLRGGAFADVIDIDRLQIAQPTLGHAERIARIKAALGDSYVLAGAYLRSGLMPDAVESGFEAADEVMKKLVKRPATVTATGGRTTEGAPVAGGRTTERPTEVAAPVVVVGASYRDAATELRAKLAAVEQGPDSPSRALLSAGYADGVVVLETCSRVEWVVSSNRPQWAADILKSALLTRVPDARLHVRAGHAAVHYMMRVAMGLDSVAEGEPAVGRQLVLAFEKAHREGTADRALRLCWRAVQQLMGDRRKRGVVRHGIGVQTLVVEELQQRGISKSSPVAVLGQGEIGRAVVAALNDAGFSTIATFRRDSRAALDEFAKECAAVIVCTGAPAAHAVLPERRDTPLVVDVGVPAQVAAAPGWISVSLEDLLQHPRRLLDDDTRAWLVDQVALGADRLARDLAAPAPAGALSVIDEERRIFLRETLPPLLEKLPSSSAEEVRRACTAFAHTLMERVREEGTS